MVKVERINRIKEARSGGVWGYLGARKKKDSEEDSKKVILNPCKKCGKREATKEDRLCDQCRYMLSLSKFVEEEKE